MLDIGRYRIIKEDDLNLGLYVKIVISKGKNEGEEKYKQIGYYGYMDTAMSKIINLELTEAIKGSGEIITARELLGTIRSAYDSLKEAYHVRPKDAFQDS